MDGKVGRWNSAKGWGFITPDDGSDDVFVHHTDITGRGNHADLFEGEAVSFHVTMTPKGRRAIRVRPLDNPYNTAA